LEKLPKITSITHFTLILKKNIPMKNLPRYFKRVFDDYQVLVKVNPDELTGTELIIHPDGKVEKTEMEFDEEIFQDLTVDEFVEGSALEFNLYLGKSVQ
jgi:hypothetical protein